MTEIDDFNALKDIATFATLVSTYDSGFQLILEPYETEGVLCRIPFCILRV